MTGSFCMRNQRKNRDRVGAFFTCGFQIEHLDLLLVRLPIDEAVTAQQHVDLMCCWQSATGIQAEAHLQARQGAPARRPSARRPNLHSPAGRIGQKYREARAATYTSVGRRKDANKVRAKLGLPHFL